MSFNVETYFTNQAKGTQVLYYSGNINPDVINHVLDAAEEKLSEAREPSKLRKRVYNVLVESLQNLYHHAEKVPGSFVDQSSEKFAVIALNKTDKGYNIITGNFIQSKNVDKLEEKIIRINRSTHEEIKELYKFILNHQRISEKGGGGLGLVDIARKTGNKLGYTFKPYDDRYSFFYLDIMVDEEN